MKNFTKLAILASITLLAGCSVVIDPDGSGTYTETSEETSVADESTAQASSAAASEAVSSKAEESSVAPVSEASSAEEVSSSVVVDEGYSVTFTYDANVTIYVYPTQDCSAETTAYTSADTVVSRNSDTGLPDSTGAGQVNFKLVFASGYVIDGDPTITVTGDDGYTEAGYKNIKNHTSDPDDVMEGCYRVTKITHSINIDIKSKAEDVPEDYTDQYKVTFSHPEDVKVTVFATQDYTAEGEETDTGYARSKTGVLDNSGDGQINFKVEVPEGYEIDAVTVTGTYSNLKDHAADDTIPEGCYRVTKIGSEITITITIKAASEGGDSEEETIDAYKVTFSHDENTKVSVFPGKDYTVTPTEQDFAYGRNKDTGDYTKTEGQVNFLITFTDGYELKEMTEDVKNYNKLEKQTLDDGDTRIIYRMTKLTGDLTLTITSQAVTA